MKINQGKLLRVTTTQDKVQSPPIQLATEYAPNAERCLRGLMIVLGIDREEIERLLKHRLEEIDQTEGVIH